MGGSAALAGLIAICAPEKKAEQPRLANSQHAVLATDCAGTGAITWVNIMGASFGLMLPNRAVILGAVAAKDLLELAMQGGASDAFDAVWVGDSLLAKPCCNWWQC